MNSSGWIIKDLAENYGMNSKLWRFYSKVEIDYGLISALDNFLGFYQEYRTNAFLKGLSAFINRPTLVLTCVGGDVLTTFGAIDLLAKYAEDSIFVDVEVYGQALSCGTLLATCTTGTRRMSKNSWLMLHTVQDRYMSAESTADGVQMVPDPKVRRMRNNFKTLLRAHSKMSEETLDAILSGNGDDTYYNATEAIALGLIDEVI